MSSSEGVCSLGSAKAVSDRHSTITTDIIVDITFFIYVSSSFHKKIGARDLFSPTPNYDNENCLFVICFY